MIALYKGKGDLEDCDSYRPISLTSVLARTVERLIYPRLYAIINQHLSIHQSGFRHGRSTVDQILAVVERARLSIAGKECLPFVFLDIKKAFDRVWHDGLMFKLYDQFRVAGRCWSWIRAFLSGRRLRREVEWAFIWLARCGERCSSRQRASSTLVPGLHQ